jgi:Ca-activated chloride channel family protein
VSVIDEGRLRDIAAQLGVAYVHRSAGDAVPARLQQARPGTLERTAEGGTLGGRTEFYWLPAAGAFVLGLAEILTIIRQLRQLRPAARPHREARGSQAKETVR